MTISFYPPLIPKNGNSLQVLGVCRISGHNQDEKSLADQENLYREWLKSHATVPFDLTIIK